MKPITIFAVFILLNNISFSQIKITSAAANNSIPIVSETTATYIITDSTDDWLIQKSAQLLQQDIEMVTGKKPQIVHSVPASKTNNIIIGCIQSSPIIQTLSSQKKINIDWLKGRWEAGSIQTIANSSSIVIAGSDKRGTAFGVFELSQKMGVSPWYWWADVPVKKKKEIFMEKGNYNFPSPSVKYRGIFINDEAPAFSGWTREKFGGVNHLVYEKIFELLLRLKANYLWPAMWGNAFNADDTLNPVLANKYGIVMGTSHHEPMLRAQQEWKRYGTGAWDYTKNDSVLRTFWRKGIENMKNHESIVTIGMRGDGDMPMTEGTATALLEKIVSDQRNIIEEVTGKPANQQPQLWALYKEVQDYYDKGMRVPDDVTLLLCDDNWGNIRKLPKLNDTKRSGGYGIYYHFDYVGDPRNYKWINTNNLARVWEQMHLAYEYGVDKIWIVNVGDLKPMELPISFFLDYAYDVKKWNEDNIQNYYEYWASEQFGKADLNEIEVQDYDGHLPLKQPDKKTYGKEIGDILEKYSQYASRRKPELLDDKTYSLLNYDEWGRISQQWDKLLMQTEKINNELPAEYKDAYFQLVLHSVKAMENLHELYYNVARNKFLASRGNITANDYADKAKQAYINDSLISLQYNQLNNGKWNHMMDQTHIGYTYWQQPEKQKMPEVKYVVRDSIVHQNKVIDSVPQPTITVVTPIPENASKNSFYQLDNYVSIEASNYTTAVNTNIIEWKIIKNIGRDGDGITTFPVTKSFETFAANSPQLQYEIYTSDTGNVKLNAYFSPTLNFHNTANGLQYAIAIDDEQPQIVSINKNDNDQKAWRKWVADNVIIKTTQHHIPTKGKHIVKYWMISNAVVLQKLVLNFGEEKESYLGAPETKN
jgi:hypothetical protein